jgi:hypothetical protein
MTTIERIPRYADGMPVAAGDNIRYRQAAGGLLPRGDWMTGTAAPAPGDGEISLERDGRFYHLFGHEIERLHTVTVTCARKRYKLKFSKLPNREFGPYGFVEAIGQLRFAANLEPLAARDLVMDAAVAEDRTATAPVG